MSSMGERGLFTRRSFLRWSQSAMALLGAAPIVGASAASEAFALPAASNSPDDYYAKLVKNCEGATSARAELKHAREVTDARAARN